MKDFSKQRALLAAGLLVACSAASPADQEGDGVSSEIQVAAAPCQNCETKEVCVDKFVSCDPPVLVNGRNITCLVRECSTQVVCTPCGGEGILSDLDAPVVDLDNGPLGPLGPLDPVDPVPLPF